MVSPHARISRAASAIVSSGSGFRGPPQRPQRTSATSMMMAADPPQAIGTNRRMCPLTVTAARRGLMMAESGCATVCSQCSPSPMTLWPNGCGASRARVVSISAAFPLVNRGMHRIPDSRARTSRGLPDRSHACLPVRLVRAVDVTRSTRPRFCKARSARYTCSATNGVRRCSLTRPRTSLVLRAPPATVTWARISVWRAVSGALPGSITVVNRVKATAFPCPRWDWTPRRCSGGTSAARCRHR